MPHVRPFTARKHCVRSACPRMAGARVQTTIGTVTTVNSPLYRKVDTEYVVQLAAEYRNGTNSIVHEANLSARIIWHPRLSVNRCIWCTRERCIELYNGRDRSCCLRFADIGRASLYLDYETLHRVLLSDNRTSRQRWCSCKYNSKVEVAKNTFFCHLPDCSAVCDC